MICNPHMDMHGCRRKRYITFYVAKTSFTRLIFSIIKQVLNTYVYILFATKSTSTQFFVCYFILYADFFHSKNRNMDPPHIDSSSSNDSNNKILGSGQSRLTFVRATFACHMHTHQQKYLRRDCVFCPQRPKVLSLPMVSVVA